MRETKFKNTEIGKIPKGWEVKKFTDCCDTLTGLTYSPINVKENGLLVLRSSNIQHSKLCFNDNVYVNLYVDKSNYLKKNDILICIRNGSEALIGKCAIADKDYDATFGAFMFAFRGENNRFIFQLLQEGKIQAKIKNNSDSTINQITRKDINEIYIPWPSLKEQEKIATHLSDVDELIDKLTKLIEKKKLIKKGTMQELLTGKKRLNRRKVISSRSSLGDLGIKVVRGSIITRDRAKAGNIPVIAGGKEPAYYCDVFNRDGKNITISGSGANAGYISYYKGKIFASDCLTISENDKYDILYLYYLLLSKQNVILGAQTGGAQPHVYPKDMYELEVDWISDINEQKNIANVLSNMDTEIEKLEKKLSKYKKIKLAMMDELLTGKIRLI